MLDADGLERQLALIRSASLPLHLTRLLVTSRRLEEYASGPARREAFRVGRAILSGLLTAGYSVRSIADVLEVSTGAVRARAQSGPIETGIKPGRLSCHVFRHGPTSLFPMARAGRGLRWWRLSQPSGQTSWA
jgi:hypothetical protein